MERAPGSERQQREFYTPVCWPSSAQSARPPGLKASHPLPNVYLDRFFRSPKLVSQRAGRFYSHLPESMGGPQIRSPGSGWGADLVTLLADGRCLGGGQGSRIFHPCSARASRPPYTGKRISGVLLGAGPDAHRPQLAAAPQWTSLGSLPDVLLCSLRGEGRA